MHKNFFHNVKVYYEDTDAGGIVYYANYLKFLERARTEALVTLGFNNKKLKNDKKIATITSSNGVASGTPKFQAITPINQIK